MYLSVRLHNGGVEAQDLVYNAVEERQAVGELVPGWVAVRELAL